jgi:hypothetical protein
VPPDAVVVVVAHTVVVVLEDDEGTVLVVLVDDVLDVLVDVLDVELVEVVEVVEPTTPQPPLGGPLGGPNPFTGADAVGAALVAVGVWEAEGVLDVVRAAVDAPLPDAGAPVVATEVWPSIRWSTWVTWLSSTVPLTDSEVDSVPEVMATVLKLASGSTGAAAFGRPMVIQVAATPTVTTVRHTSQTIERRVGGVAHVSSTSALRSVAGGRRGWPGRGRRCHR